MTFSALRPNESCLSHALDTCNKCTPIGRFCHQRVVSACVCLLEQYLRNSPYTNHCTIKMLHRVAWDCNRPAIMFQGTLFVVFQRVLRDPAPVYKVGLFKLLYTGIMFGYMRSQCGRLRLIN